MLRWLALVSAVLELAGTVLIVWGLDLKKSQQGSEWRTDLWTEVPFAVVIHERPWALVWGKWLLLAGLTLAIVAAVLAP